MGIKSRINSRTSRTGARQGHLPRRKGRVAYALLGVLATSAAVAAYVFSQPVADASSTSVDWMIATFGMGVLPIGLWGMAFMWTAIARRSWSRYLNLWLGSAALVPLILGSLAFFEAAEGGLSRFTLGGDVSLGGGVGEAIIGPTTWLGVLRLIAIGIAGLALTFPPVAAYLASRVGRLTKLGYALLRVQGPPLALGSATRLGKLAKYGYIHLAIAVPPLVAGLASGVGRSVVNVYIFVAVAIQSIANMYRLDRRERPVPRGPSTGDDGSRSSQGVEVPGIFNRDRSRIGAAPMSGENRSNGAPHAFSMEAPRPTDASSGGMTTIESGVEFEVDDIADEQAEPSAEGARSRDLPIVGKFNSLWTAHTAEPDREPTSAGGIERETAGPEAGENEWERDLGDAPVPQAQRWERPPIRLLNDGVEGGISDEETKATAEKISKTLAEYGVEVEVGQITPGPTVTMYGLIPGWVRRYKRVKDTDDMGQPKLDQFGKPLLKQVESKTRIKVDNILSREKDLALALKTPSIRIETPAMGKSLVGIEVPNPNPTLVTLRSVMQSDEFVQLRAEADLPLALGKASGGEAVVTDLAKMPHLLIAGATGSGKSVCINAIISCLIMEKTPMEMRLLLIDPKRVELTPFNGVPHLLTPVVVETDHVVGLLKGLIREMLDRYRRMEEVGVRNIEAYNKKTPSGMPFLVVAVDELADLMMSAAFDVEQSLCRLAQLGRATGIHLIVATQRPSVDVVTGLIKANFPSRISFGVTSQVDSRTILDTPGADKLLGRGDMLYLPLDASRPVRAQSVFISDREIEDLVGFWQTTPRGPLSEILLHTLAVDGDEEGPEGDWDAQDEFLDKAIELALSYSKMSTSLLQRRLRIGYPRAARLMDQLEDQGVVGPSDGSKSRDVIMGRV